MCAHESPQEAARCVCTGYGFGDPLCRCSYPRSQHRDGTGACTVAAARCHEFVLRMDDPFPVTVALVRAASEAVITELNVDPVWAQQAAMAALFGARKHAMDRDYELKSVRAQNDRLRKQLRELQRKLDT